MCAPDAEDPQIPGVDDFGVHRGPARSAERHRSQDGAIAARIEIVGGEAHLPSVSRRRASHDEGKMSDPEPIERIDSQRAPHGRMIEHARGSLAIGHCRQGFTLHGDLAMASRDAKTRGLSRSDMPWKTALRTRATASSPARAPLPSRHERDRSRPSRAGTPVDRAARNAARVLLSRRPRIVRRSDRY